MGFRIRGFPKPTLKQKFRGRSGYPGFYPSEAEIFEDHRADEHRNIREYEKKHGPLTQAQLEQRLGHLAERVRYDHETSKKREYHDTYLDDMTGDNGRRCAVVETLRKRYPGWKKGRR